MDIVSVLKRHGIPFLILDRSVGLMLCPWCVHPCHFTLVYDRFVCEECGESGLAEYLAWELRNSRPLKHQPDLSTDGR